MATLDELIDDALAHPILGPTPVENLTRRGAARQRRRRAVVAFATAIALVGGVEAVLAWPLWAGRTRVVVGGTSGAWKLIGPRADATGPAVWDGKEVLFPRVAFNPSTDAWRRLPRSPLSPGLDPYFGFSSVWTGREMIVWDFRQALPPGTGMAAAFNPASNTWRLLASPPSSIPQARVVWTGHELVVVGVSAPAIGSPLAGAVYDLADNAWRSMAPAPIACANPEPLWTGGRVIVVCTSYAPTTFHPVAMSYDPAADAWGTLPDPPFLGNDTAVWTGNEILEWAGSRLETFDPSTNQWRELTTSPLAYRYGSVVVWTGHRLIVWGGQLDGPALRGVARADWVRAEGAAYDPRTNAWSPLPPTDLSARAGAAGVWTGEAMLVWGGTGFPPTSLNDGAFYTPPPGA